MNRAKRAIILAAGMGSRMRPITDAMPKPLIPVNGVRMIDTVIDALHQNGIFEISIVVGYRKRQFEPIKDAYDGIRLIENPFYETCNNISSLYVARESLLDCVILDGDQIIYNPGVLYPEFEKSGYCSIWTEGFTKEWLQTVEDGRVTSCSRTGGRGGWQLMGASFWAEEDGIRLRECLEMEFMQKKNTGIYWDDVALFCHPEKFDLGIRPIRRGDIVEIDSVAELIELDPSYGLYGNQNKLGEKI